MRSYIAELIGTFLLTLAVSVSLVADLGLPTPLIAGFTVLVLVYAIGTISGAHLNPAVTVGLLSVGKISPRNAIGYIVAQCIGALFVIPFLGLLALQTPSPSLAAGIAVMIAECIGAFVLIFAIASVVYGRTPREAAGLTIGGGLTIGALIAAAVSNAVLNPAIALALGLFSVSYLVAPLLGGIAAAWVYRWIALEK